jgi:hypothetical protein
MTPSPKSCILQCEEIKTNWRKNKILLLDQKKLDKLAERVSKIICQIKPVRKEIRQKFVK